MSMDQRDFAERQEATSREEESYMQAKSNKKLMLQEEALKLQRTHIELQHRIIKL
jgi:hypothetical protein